MYSDSKYYGDDGSAGEELLANIPELEQKALVVEKAVKEGYFTIEQALSLYKISEIEYVAYLLLKNKNKLGTTTKIHQVLGAVSFIVKTFSGASSQFDLSGKKIMQELETLSHNSI